MGHAKGQPLRFINGHNQRRHGMASEKSPEYMAYENAKFRCINPNHPSWKDYGGRGIEFRFKSFELFIADIGLRPRPDLTLDRINNDAHYEPGNVRWATRSTQQSNQRPRARAKDLTGQRFGNFVVIRRAKNRRDKATAQWECLCDCGEIRTVRGDALTSGRSKSCGHRKVAR